MNSNQQFTEFLNIILTDIKQARGKININSNLLKIKNNIGETVFHYLVVENKRNLTEVLLELGSDINTQSDSGATPLINAIELNYFKMVKWLIKMNATLETQDNFGNTALSVATNNELKDIFMYLIKLPRANPIDYYYPDLDAEFIFDDKSLVMRNILLKLGLKRRFID